MRSISVKLFKIGPLVQEEMPLKIISYLKLWLSLWTAEQTICAIFVEGIMETFMWNYFKFGPVVQEKMSFKEKV